ncbi:MAG: substrate-binding domain-containing protein [Anaerolineae bacterium]|nr:substrate-binding domain-containing protein [Anaerolineae bacterium]
MMCRPRCGRGAAILPLLLAVFVLLLSAPACAPQPLRVTREPATLHLVAADSCAALVRNAASAYEADHPWVTATSQVLNNALAAEALQNDEADLGLLSWGSVGGEAQPLWKEPFARDGVAVIVHPASSLTEISLAQLRGIFLGRVQEQNGVVLTVVSREDGSGTRAALENIVLDDQDTTLNAVVVPSSEAMVDYVGATPSAVGYVSTRYLDDRVRALPVEGVTPTETAIANGSYPIWRQLYLASSGDPTGEARQFAQWLLRGGGLVEGAGR